MGGFLQSILFGYAGLRLTVEKLTANPKLPPGITNFTIQGLDYLDCSFDVNIQADTVAISWKSGQNDGCANLVVEPTTAASTGEWFGTEAIFKQFHPPPSYPLAQQSSRNLQMDRKPFTIRRARPLTCPLPEDEQPMAAQKQSKNRATSNDRSTFLLSTILLLTTLCM